MQERKAQEIVSLGIGCLSPNAFPETIDRVPAPPPPFFPSMALVSYVVIVRLTLLVWT